MGEPVARLSQGAEVLGNLNAPPAVTASAVIYALRCLLPGDAADVPLNQVRNQAMSCRVMSMCQLLVYTRELYSRRQVDLRLSKAATRYFRL